MFLFGVCDRRAVDFSPSPSSNYAGKHAVLTLPGLFCSSSAYKSECCL